tara:strand:+ start:10117 stop:10665 length:549 start_codon:yes stop_codon:yes gene_type:complete
LSETPIFKRKSSVNFSPKEISNEDIELIIKASVWAPSSRNRQPWRIIAIKKDSKKFNALIECMSSGNQSMAKSSGLILIFSTNNEKEFSPKTFLDIGFSGQNAMIQATDLGLETHPIGGWDEESVKKVTDIPEYSKVAFLLIIGNPGDLSDLSDELLEKHNKVRERNPLEQNFNYDEWGKNF